ncbi:type I polyketide synthase [Amycolatopsis sp. NPDC088138]|uniref:type I polyketide synthase n=1 Tax=Amycolatopsis sp. NPDC088138 TaxID=3363938 RepID=UPI00381FAC4E
MSAAMDGVREPVAIIGMAARVPGADSPEELWQLLRREGNAIAEVPANRFTVEDFYDAEPATPGRMMSRFGGFLEDIEDFDAEFFGISPREAECMDPQQRLLMEVAWEAFEDAGLTLDGVSTLNAAVLMGVITSDYWDRQSHRLQDLDVHTVGGSTRGGNAGRISYALNLRGLSVAVDAACSSSLVGVHLAVRSLRAGDCDVAFAGGVNMILNPDHAIGFSQGKMMAPDGQCKAFDARADGYVRSEGAAVVALKLLSRAIEDGDRIHAVIRGSAASNDGHGETFMAPQVEGQSAGLRAAYRDAGVAPGSVGYVEAHGTGTSVGDPVEIGALQEVLGEARPAGQPVLVGSVKTNVGHTEGAAGAVGLIKAALCVQKGFIPRSLNFETPSPAIPWADINVEVAAQARDWHEENGPRRAGVSSFGITGTNVHVVLEEPPAVPAGTARHDRPVLLTLSARSDVALPQLAASYRDLLARKESSLADVAGSAAVRRTHHAQRLALVAASPEEAIERLDAVARGGFPEDVVTGDADDDLDTPHPTAWVFPGQGGQWLGMGRALLTTEPVFATKIAACEAAMAPHVDWSLTAELTAAPEDSQLARIDVAQPVIFAVQVALAALWQDRGMTPDVVVGHSMGEVAAAHVAGILDLDDAALLICLRSRLLRKASGQGVMAAVDLSPEDAEAVVARYPGVSLAVCNGPVSCVLSGDETAITEILETVSGRRVKVDVASHSSQMDPLRGELLELLAPLKPRAGHTPLRSTVHGRVVDGANLGPAYWMDNLREPVLFGPVVQALAEEGVDTFVEFSPHPLLSGSVRQNLGHAGKNGVVVATMSRDCGDRTELLHAVAELYVAGRPVPLDRLHGPDTRYVPLPTYPWQRERYWREELVVPTGEQPVGLTATSNVPAHPIIGAYLRLAPGDSYVWDVELDLGRLRYLAEHRVHDIPVLPGAAYHELALAAGTQIHGDAPFAVRDLSLERALFFSPDTPARLQIRCTRDESGGYGWSCYTDDGEWLLLATAALRAEPEPAAARLELPNPSRFPDVVDVGDHYAASAARGIVQTGPFRTITSLRRAEAEILAEFTVDGSITGDVGKHVLHPALLDCALQPLMSLLLGEDVAHDTYLPVGTTRFHGSGVPTPGASLWCHVTRTSPEGETDLVRGDYVIGDSTGKHLLTIEDFRLKRLGGDLPELVEQRIRDLRYDLAWEPAEPCRAGAGGGPVLVVGDGAAVYAELSRRGVGTVLAPRHSADGWEQILKTVDAEHGTARAVLYVHAGDRIEETADALELIQALAALPAPPRLWFITRGAQAVTEGASADPLHTALWGLGRVVRYEIPDLRCSLIDLPGIPSAADLSKLCTEISADGPEDEIALRDGVRHLARLTHGSLPDVGPVPVRADGTYLITGGLGGVGLLTARWLVEQGARHLVLTGRSGPDEQTREQLRSLGDADVRVVRADVADSDRMADVLADIDDTMPPLRGVVHSAVTLDDGILTQLDAERFLSVLPPKVDGAWNLHLLTRNLELDFFVLYSSAASLIGSPGQGNYAVANAYVDGLAHYRRAQGLPALSVNWGQWTATGRVAKADHDLRLDDRGFKGFAPADGLAVLGRLLRGDQAQAAVMSFDPEVWAKDFPALRTGSLLHDFDTTPEAGTSGVTVSDLDDTAAQAAISAYLCGQVATVVKAQPDRVQGGQRLNRLGIDSLMAVQLRNRITEDLGASLPVAVFLQRGTIDHLAEVVLSTIRTPEGSQ